MISAKYMDDFYYSNAVYAKLGGIPLAELNRMEIELLSVFDFRVAIDPMEFELYLDRLETYVSVLGNDS